MIFFCVRVFSLATIFAHYLTPQFALASEERPLKPPAFRIPAEATLAQPSPSPTPEAPYTHFFIGLNLTGMKVEFTPSETEFDLGFTAGYLLTPHHQFNVLYLGQSFRATQLSFNRYLAAYRYNLGDTPSKSFFIQVSGGWVNVKVGGTSTTKSTLGFELGKNFKLFESSNVVFSPTIGIEKFQGSETVVRLIPLNFGFFF